MCAASAIVSPGDTDVLDFDLSPELEAHEPPEAAGRPRDDVRLMVSHGLAEPVDTTLNFLPRHLRPGDLVVVNTSATIAAALDGVRADGEEVAVHLSTPLPTGTWLVEVRRRVTFRPSAVEDDPTTTPTTPPTTASASATTTEPYGRTMAGEELTLPGGATLRGLRPWRWSDRLTEAELRLPAGGADEGALLGYLARWGRPIRYRHVPVPWPIATYQTVFADRPGSAEMPSASRPFTTAMVTRLVAAGVAIAPVTLHTGVSSLEEHEDPYPERFDVPQSTAHRVADTRARGGRVIGLGTTAVRALESAVDDAGRPVAASGWTERVVTPADPPGLVDGLITGWHEPRSSHLRMLEAVAGRPALELAYDLAVRAGYRWHEFGDLHLILPPD